MCTLENCHDHFICASLMKIVLKYFIDQKACNHLIEYDKHINININNV